jgi:DNA mismatch repair protein MSH2
VRPGPCLESFGIQVAEMANMPQSIIIEAKRKAKQLENFDYRKRSKLVEDDGSADGHEASEKTAAAMEFLHRFRKLPIDKMDHKEIQSTVIPLLRQYGLLP